MCAAVNVCYWMLLQQPWLLSDVLQSHTSQTLFVLQMGNAWHALSHRRLQCMQPMVKHT